jgi:hypothetical protein
MSSLSSLEASQRPDPDPSTQFFSAAQENSSVTNSSANDAADFLQGLPGPFRSSYPDWQQHGAKDRRRSHDSQDSAPQPGPSALVLQDILNRLVKLEGSVKGLQDVSREFQVLRNDVDGLMATVRKGESTSRADNNPGYSPDSFSSASASPEKVFSPLHRVSSLPAFYQSSDPAAFPPPPPPPSHLTNSVSQLSLAAAKQHQYVLRSPSAPNFLQLDANGQNSRFSIAAKPFTPAVERRVSPAPMNADSWEPSLSPTTPIITPGAANLYEKWEACGLRGPLLKAVAQYG